MTEYKILHDFLNLPRGNYLDMIINFIPKDIINNWISRIEILTTEPKIDLIEMFNDENKKKVYNYINNIKSFYSKYYKNEFEDITNEYNKFQNEYLNKIYVLYLLKDGRHPNLEHLTDQDITDKIMFSINTCNKDTSLILALKNGDSFTNCIINNTYIYFENQYFYISKNNNEYYLILDSIENNRTNIKGHDLITIHTSETSLYYTISYLNLLDKYGYLDMKYDRVV